MHMTSYTNNSNHTYRMYINVETIIYYRSGCFRTYLSSVQYNKNVIFP